MSKEVSAYNLSVPGVGKEFFSSNFYKTKCKKIDFDGVIKEYLLESEIQTDYISLASKFIPHSDYELMLMSTDSICKSSINSLSDLAIDKILETAFKYIQFVNVASNVEKYGLIGGYPYLVYNYDEFTFDRYSPPTHKDFHLHMNFFQSNTMKKISVINESNVSSFYYKSVVEPIFEISQILARDALLTSEFDDYIEYVEPQLGNQDVFYSAVYLIKDGWNFFHSYALAELLKKVHTKLEDRYIEILQCLCGADCPPTLYTRHKLLPMEVIKNNIMASKMQNSTKNALLGFVGRLKDIDANLFQKISKKPNFRDSMISLRWLSYSVGFFSNSFISYEKPYMEQPMYMNVSPKLFTKIGGASIMNFPNYPLVKLDRNSGIMSHDKFEFYSSFHRDFCAYIGE